jgi:hypothetical protein
MNDTRPAGTAALALVLLSSLQGCYLVHGRDAPGDPPTPAHDAGGPSLVDAGLPPADPLPAEPDPDLGPDARPSDYPDADDWEDPPDIPEDAPCCELGEPILITSRDEGRVLAHEPPSIAWGPGRWGLLATQQMFAPEWEHDPRAVVFELAADGTSLGPPVVLDRETDRAGVIRWAEGRWAVAVSGASLGADVREWHAQLFDRDLRPASEWIALGPARVFQIDLARMTAGDRWVAMRNDRTGLARTPFSDRGADRVAVRAQPMGTTLDAVGMRSRVVVLLGQSEGGVRNEVFALGAPPSYTMFGPLRLRTQYESQAALAAVRDRVVAVGIEGGVARVEALDPFTLVEATSPRSLGDATESDHAMFAIDAAGSSKHGLAGVCWGVGEGGPDGGRDATNAIDFRLVGPDGVPRGRAVRIVEGTFRGGMVNCSVGSDDEGFLVSWWNGSELWVRRVDVPR